MDTIRVLIADDQAIMRSGLRNLLADFAYIEVIAEASDGAEAVRLANLHQPDVILMDLKMPVLSGIEAIQQICRVHPHISILVITMLENDTTIFPAIRAGARGYLLKDIEQQELAQAIQTVASGGVIFSAGIANRVLAYLSDAPRNIPTVAFDELTNREREILELIAQGLTNAEIADRLSLSPKTVSNNVSNVLVKLQVVDRAKLILLALEAGIGKKDPTGF
ncbi:MAG TPA: response regulator transcription factor [Phototrophicaceae bacterium]|jgi:DNA-binding NarL/FixJ family response regulator|nr:response regulator transcription factor [Phototrophicaceae bacterium]